MTDFANYRRLSVVMAKASQIGHLTTDLSTETRGLDHHTPTRSGSPNTNDSGTGSLRQALAVAINGDTIDAMGVSGGILLTCGALQTNSLTNFDVRIIGPGARHLAIDGNAIIHVFKNFARAVTISGFTVTNGHGGSAGGGGIFNQGGLTLSNSSVVSNTGGGIYNKTANGLATLTVSNCTISGNMASNGGGIYNAAFEVEGIATAIVAISNSTLSGGGIYNNGDAGGQFTRPGNAELELGNTILSAGSSGENIVNNLGRVTSLGYNLASDNGGGFLRGPGDQIHTDPRLGPLQNNGGPTFTQALLPGSPAINRGNPNFTPPPSFDQRGPGYRRVVNGRIDIGSFEVQVTPTPTPTPP